MNMSKEEKIVIASALICQVLAIFAIIILGNMYFPIPDWNMKIIMRKYIIHFTIWLIGLFCYGILYNFTHLSEIRSMSILLGGCLLFYSIYYIAFFSKAKKVEYSVNASGVLGGRGVGF